MKKILFVMVLAVALVLTFAATAMASGGVPNRSSAFLGSLPDTSVAAVQGIRPGLDAEWQLAAGGNKQAYISWGQSQALMAAAEARVSGSTFGYMTGVDTPHGGYATTTAKCQVCHSVHKAYLTGQKLTMGASGGCIACHGATSAFGGIAHVSAGGTDDMTDTTTGAQLAAENRHGGDEQCTNGYCHTASPHGAGDLSTYPAGRSALLNNKLDAKVAAALVSGSTNAPATAQQTVPIDAAGNYVWSAAEGDYYATFDVAIYQPAFDAPLSTYVTVAQTTTANVDKGRAIVTGYVCNNDGCHINGAFNALSPDAYWGAYVFNSVSGTTTAPSVLEADLEHGLRNQAIKGHTLFDTFTGTATNGQQRAFAASGTCRACHDRVDVRTNDYAFPHSNAVWAVDATEPSGYTKLYNDAAWFTLAANTVSAHVSTNTRTISGTTGTYEPLTIAMDGACLKCHATATSGVGLTF